jgi:putative peptidoglycan lipid II flippase
MIRSILSVGGFTLLSRIAGFMRDLIMAAVLGAGSLMDAFTVAFRLPNHFRAIFGEGAFNAAFVPAYTRIRTQDGDRAASLFQGRILSLLLASQVVLLLVALLFTPAMVRLLAPGFAADSGQFRLAVELTRITFPYLLLITLVTLWSGVLNSAGRYAAAAGAPILLNLALIVFVLMAALFRTPAHAAAWGVFVAGILEAILLVVAVQRAGLLAMPGPLTISDDIRQFFKSFLPAVIGSAGVQIAMFADTILSTLLPAGSASALYYADRIYQLPLGIIAIAAGTVLLPVMSKHLATGAVAEAHEAQNRTLALTLFLAAPCWVATLIIPDLIIRAVFQRGAFDATAAETAAGILAAYGVGLIAMVSIRSVVSGFHARGDTRMPMLISLGAVAFNVLLKVVLISKWGFDLGVMGLALATALGATLNLAVLGYVADARGWIDPDRQLLRSLAVIALACLGLALTLGLLRGPIGASGLSREVQMLVLVLCGGVVYGAFSLLGLRVAGIRLRRLSK